MSRMVILSVFLLLGVTAVSACSGLAGGSVFVGARHEPIECENDGAATCIRVYSEVEGIDTGTGSCILYARTDGGQVAVAASPDLDLIPDSLVEWIVRVPSHFEGWNPVCIPAADG